jgi:transmembrane sensor
MTANMDEAARWFAALRRGMMTLDERAAFRLWRSDPANEALFAELGTIWESLGAVRPADFASFGRAGGPRRRGAVVRSAVAGAVFAAMLAGAGSLPHLGSAPSWTELDWWSR